jgi:phenylpyruvate tautomerase PptA (4-oxalocrotonate tautomerase family)
MPFVRITLSTDRPEPMRAAVAEGVRSALVSAIGVPPDDRFQIVDAQPATAFHVDRHFLDGDRRDPVVVEITLTHGRTRDMKLALYQAIVANLSEVGVRPDDVLIMLQESGREDWSLGGGKMQLLDEDLIRKYGWSPPEA